MTTDDGRRRALRLAVAAAATAATPISFVNAMAAVSTGKIPARIVMDLADGNRIQIVLKDGALVGRVLDARGQLVRTPAGKLKLKSGKILTFDPSGRLTQGEIADQAFLLECDPPPSPSPPLPAGGPRPGSSRSIRDDHRFSLACQRKPERAEPD